jgi:hypothetical protein
MVNHLLRSDCESSGDAWILVVLGAPASVPQLEFLIGFIHT